MADALDALRGVAPTPSLVSIDLFDTLLVRPQGSAAARRAWAEVAAALLRARGFVITTKALLDARWRAERRALSRRGVDRPDPVPRHRELLEETLRELVGSSASCDVIDAVARAEIDVETAATRVDGRLAAWVERLARGGTRVVVTSDMYLSSEQLAEILRRHSVGGFARIYASSDVGRTKFSGRLFRHLLAEEGVSPEAVVHLGDHPISDVLVPRTLGIRARWIPPRGPARSRVVARATGADDGSALGREILGPALVTAVEIARERCEAMRADLVLFVARDAELLMRIAERGAPWSARLQYAHLSRPSTLAAALPTLDADTAARMLSLWRVNRGLSTLFDALSIDGDAFGAVLRAAEWGLVDRPVRDPRSDPALRALLGRADFQRVYAAQSANARALLERYLEGLGFFAARRVALIDVGWRGSIQHALRRAFEGHPRAPIVRGLYVGRWDDEPTPLAGPALPLEGLLCDQTRSESLLEAAAFELSWVIESVCSAREGTTLGYRSRGDGSVEPVLAREGNARREELLSEALTEPLRRGVLAAAGDQTWRAGDAGARRGAMQRRLARMAYLPTREEIELCAGLVHTEGALPWLALRAVPSARPSPVRSPTRWLSGMSVPWRGGYAAATGGLTASVLYAAARAALLSVPVAPRNDVRERLRALVRKQKIG